MSCLRTVLPRPVRRTPGCRKPIPIVRPEWVVASIAAGRLLPVRASGRLLAHQGHARTHAPLRCTAHPPTPRVARAWCEGIVRERGVCSVARLAITRRRATKDHPWQRACLSSRCSPKSPIPRACPLPSPPHTPPHPIPPTHTQKNKRYCPLPPWTPTPTRTPHLPADHGFPAAASDGAAPPAQAAALPPARRAARAGPRAVPRASPRAGAKAGARASRCCVATARRCGGGGSGSSSAPAARPGPAGHPRVCRGRPSPAARG